MDADFTTGPGDSRSSRQPGYRLTHPDAPGTSPNPVLTGIDTGGPGRNGHDALGRNGHDALGRNGHDGLGRNGHDQQVQWSSAPVTLRGTPESDALSRRIAPDLPQRSADLPQRSPDLPQRNIDLTQRAPELPQRTADPEAVAARLAADNEPFSARITTDSEPFGAPTTNEESYSLRPAANGSPFTHSVNDSGALTRPAADSGPFTRSVADIESFASPLMPESDTLRPAAETPAYAPRTDSHESVFGAAPAVDFDAPVSRRYAPDPEPSVRFEAPERLEAPARLENLDAPASLESLEAVAASLRESVQDAPRESVRPKGVPSRRRAAPKPVVEQQDSIVTELVTATPAATEVAAPESVVVTAPVTETAVTESKATEFRTSDATIDLHHIMRLLLASHELEVAATAAESGAGDIEKLAQAAHRTRSAAVELVAAWYGGADHMRNFGEVLLQAAAETA
ncbi:hypothetical protein KHQ06_09775 [Nocardia tengchongensis]|uniref:Uncharacterized protein n=1 Tax=Nocardia tengchongensis TaxID=2055889 RepID=A0ABX8CW89_9NOCA|nr:hypothetical protein [Nocardia tengchongensis]QVI23169.1 hypothetical protein KHQ06_09775 [Nocardia tengchongensis]